MLSEKTLQHPILCLIVFSLLFLMGLFTVSNVSVSLMPDTDMPYLTVSASYPNAGPESVEKSVTSVLEDSLVSLNNLKSINSTSYEGGCRVSLEFNFGTNLDIAANDVRDKLDRVRGRLPDKASTSIFKMDSNARPIMRIAIRGNRSADELKAIAENTVADVLEQADGVAEAGVMGGRTAMVRVELDQNRLQAYGLTLTGVSSVLSRQNLELGGGSITENKTDYSIRTVGEYQSVQEINDTVVTTRNGYDVKISDIGRAYMGYSDTTSQVYINGVPGVYMSISKQSGENSVAVADGVYEKIEQVKTLLPSDVYLEIIQDETVSIRDTISTLVKSGIEGLILAIIILWIFLCSFKSTIIIGISIPLSIVITLLCMSFAGITLNMMTLTGLILGIGMIVDASIVMIDNIYAYRSRGTKPKVAAILGSQEMLMSVFSGNLTTICVFIPFLLFMKDLGFMGQMFKDIIFTIIISLASSLLVAVFLVPVLAGFVLPLTNRNEKPVRSVFFKTLYGGFNFVQDKIRQGYRFLLKKALRYRLVTIVICVSILLISLAMIPTMTMIIMPYGSADSVTVSMTLPIGTNIEETSQLVMDFQKIVEEEVSGYKYLITSIGSGGRSGSSYSGSIQITLPDSDTKSAEIIAIQNKLRAHFNDFPNVTFTFGRGMRGQMTGDDFDVVIRSASLDSAMAVARQVKEVMEKIPDIGEPAIDTNEGLPQIEIEIDRARAYNMGVNVYTVANEISASIQGTAATTFRKDGEEYSVYVMLQPSDRSSTVNLENIYVAGSAGLVPVSSFASVKKGFGPVSINHENRSRIVHVVGTNLNEERNTSEIEREIQKGIAESFIIPDGISISYEGSAKETRTQVFVYVKMILLAILLVFGVMAATYESFKAPIINLTTIPFLSIGVIGIYKIINQPFSLLSAIGLIMLVGIVVNNGIILVDYTNLLVDRGVTLRKACLEAGSSRLRPVLMTTLTTILGMLPMCFANSGSAGLVQPIGLAVVGGLTSSTFITLFFIPVFYSLIMKPYSKRRKNKVIQIDGETGMVEARANPDFEKTPAGKE